jgi:hypothetical protein
MSFNNRYAITEFKIKENARLSFSIDERNDEICGVLLFIPKLTERDHYHILFKKNELKKILEIINNKKGSIKIDTYYNIVFEDMNLIVQEEYKDNQASIFNIKLKNDILNEMKNWIKTFLSYNINDLKNKYYKDLKNIK